MCKEWMNTRRSSGRSKLRLVSGTSSLLKGLCLVLMCVCLNVQAQRIFTYGYGNGDWKDTEVTGHVQMEESESKQIMPLANAGIRVYCLTDSTYNGGMTVTDKDGNFILHAFQQRSKDYEVHISYLGTDTYKHRLTRVNIIRLDTITLHEKPITMEEAVIVAKLKKMRILGDTTIFNTDAFRVSEGAVLLELVRKMPGLRITQGKMTYQGKDISEILLNGEKFFANDISIALQNMPVEVLKEVRIYDKKSEKSELTGVDDGQHQTVMDLKTKQEVNDALMANASAGIGDQDLYGLNAMLNYFKTGGDHASVYANQHNTPNDIGMDMFGGQMFSGGFFGGGGNPMRQLSRRMGGSVGKKMGKVHANGDISYNSDGNDTKSYTVTENYLPTENTYSNQSSLNSTNGKNVSANVNIMGDLSERLGIMGNFRFGNYRNDNRSSFRQATFNTRPSVADPLEDEDGIPLSQRINRINQESLASGDRKSLTGTLMLTYRFAKEGRNLTLNLNGSKDDGESRRYQQSSTRYYQLGDSLLIQDRFTLSPTSSDMLSASLSYHEPLSEHVGIELSYGYNTNRNKEDEQVFDLGRFSFPDGNRPIGSLPEGYEAGRIDSLSNVNNRRDNQHTFGLSLNLTRDKWNMNAGIHFIPQSQNIYMLREQSVTDTTLHRLNIGTALMAFYSRDKLSLSISYSGNSRSPDADQLLPVINNDNPLYIMERNPDLKTSYSHNVNTNFRLNRLWANLSFSQSFNDLTYKTLYDPVSGVRTNRPDNINGNWGTMLNVGYSKDWEEFSLETETSYSYNNRPNYVEVSDRISKDAVRNHNFGQLLKGIYTPEWAEFILSGRFDMDKTKAKVERSSDSFTKTFTFLAETNFYLPLNIRLGSSFSCITRHGFLSDDMNHSELLWNANASWSFLKKKQASLKLEVYDILNRAKNITTYTTSTGSTQSRSEGVNSYCLLSFNYRFNLFKGKKEMED